MSNRDTAIRSMLEQQEELIRRTRERGDYVVGIVATLDRSIANLRQAELDEQRNHDRERGGR